MGYLLALGVLLSSSAFLVQEQTTHISKGNNKQIIVATNWTVNTLKHGSADPINDWMQYAGNGWMQYTGNAADNMANTAESVLNNTMNNIHHE